MKLFLSTIALASVAYGAGECSGETAPTNTGFSAIDCSTAGQDEGGACSTTAADGKFGGSVTCTSAAYVVVDPTDCTDITNKASDATITCTSSSNSQLVGDCDAEFFKTAGTADTCGACAAACVDGTSFEATACSTAADRVCTTCATPTCVAGTTFLETCAGSTDSACTACTACVAGKFEATACTVSADAACTDCDAVANAATVTCTAAGASTAATCNDGYFLNTSTCAGCTMITNKATAATVTCTNSSDSQLTGDCAANYTKTQGMADTCVEDMAPSPTPAPSASSATIASIAGSVLFFLTQL